MFVLVTEAPVCSRASVRSIVIMGFVLDDQDCTAPKGWPLHVGSLFSAVAKRKPPEANTRPYDGGRECPKRR